MKGKSGLASSVLRPVLDTYMDAAVALVGCTAQSLDRYSCEYDVLVVTDERLPSASIRIGDSFADLMFVTENDVLKPRNPEHSFSVAFAKPVRDSTLVLSTGTAANLAVSQESARKASRTRLSSALKILGRATEALQRGSLVDADFWLLAASYEYAYAWLLSKEVMPCPSHLLSQLRGASRGRARGFEGFSMGAGLEAAGRAGCGARLEGVTVLHDLLIERSRGVTTSPSWSTARIESISAKARELVTRVELAECYSFLGQELVDDLMALLKLSSKRSLGSLTSGGERLLGERLVRQLGVARTEKSVKTGLDALREQVSSLARAS